MAQDNVLDGGSEIAEAGLPKPEFTESSQPNPSELSAEAIAKQDEQRLKDTEERLWRKIQGKLDKDQAEVKRTYGELSEVQAALAAWKEGKDPSEFESAFELREIKRELAELKQAAPTQASPNGKVDGDKAFDKAVGLVTEAGLANDPEVLELFKTYKGKPDDFVIEVSRKVIARNTKTQPSAASASAPAGGMRTAGNAEAIQAQIDAIYSDSQKALSSEGRAEAKALAKQLEALEAK
jgi:hypothetical protein